MKKQTVTNLFEVKPKQVKPFIISEKFDVPSIYYNRKYYFPNDIKEQKLKNGEVKTGIQVVYYSYKWYQDTHYITKEFADQLIQFAKDNKIYIN